MAIFRLDSPIENAPYPLCHANVLQSLSADLTQRDE